MSTLRFSTLLVAFAIVLGACSGAATPLPASGPPSTAGQSGTITVTNAWARAAAAGTTGGAYLTITNGGSAADALLSVSSPAAPMVEMHETVPMGAPSPAASLAPSASPSAGMGCGACGPVPSSGGMMGMRPVARIDVPAGGAVELKPGSYHLMLVGLTADLRPGASIQLTLTFEKAGQVTVSAEVRAS